MDKYFEVQQESLHLNDLITLYNTSGQTTVTTEFPESFVPDRNVENLTKVITFVYNGKNMKITVTRIVNQTTLKTYVTLKLEEVATNG